MYFLFFILNCPISATSHFVNRKVNKIDDLLLETSLIDNLLDLKESFRSFEIILDKIPCSKNVIIEHKHIFQINNTITNDEFIKLINDIFSADLLECIKTIQKIILEIKNLQIMEMKQSFSLSKKINNYILNPLNKILEIYADGFKEYKTVLENKKIEITSNNFVQILTDLKTKEFVKTIDNRIKFIKFSFDCFIKPSFEAFYNEILLKLKNFGDHDISYLSFIENECFNILKIIDKVVDWIERRKENRLYKYYIQSLFTEIIQTCTYFENFPIKLDSNTIKNRKILITALCVFNLVKYHLIVLIEVFKKLQIIIKERDNITIGLKNLENVLFLFYEEVFCEKFNYEAFKIIYCDFMNIQVKDLKSISKSDIFAFFVNY